MKKIYLIITLSLIFIFKGRINAQCPVSIQVIESSGLTVNDSIICNGDQVILIASGGVTFLWSTGATATSSFITVTPNTTTTYTVTITDTLSVSCSASVQITVNPLPTVSAGNVSGCAGTPIVLSGSPPGGTFSVPNPYIGSGTTYTYSYNDGNGCSDISSSANITVNASPIASITETDNSGSANNDNIICSGDNATLDATHPSGTAYLWSNGSTAATITVSPASGSTYTVTVTSADGCSATSSLLIMVNPLPPAQIFEFDNSGTTANDNIICSGSGVTLTACCGASYLWSNATTTATISDSPATNSTYTVTVTGADGCTLSASVLITVNTLPNAAIVETDNSGVASNDGIIILGNNATLTASGGIAYLWSNGITVAANTVSPGTAGTYTYTVTVTNANGCSATASATITVLSSSAASITETDNSGSTPNDGIICEGGNATLTALALNDSLFLWSNGSSTPAITVTPLSTATYTVTITDNNNATSTASVQITVKSLPIVSIIETDNSGVAPNDSIIIAGFNATLTATGGGTYLWSNGTTTAATIVTPATTTTYTVTVTSADGCSSTASIPITVLSSSSASITETDSSGSAPNDEIVCAGDFATLTASALNDSLFLWSNGSTTDTITVFPATTTTYIVTVTNSNGATSTASIQIIVKPLPVAQITETDNSGSTPDDNIICEGDNAILTATGGASYLWSNASTTATITVSPLTDITYTVTVTSADSCSSTASIPITVKPLPNAQIFEFDNSGVSPNDNIIISGDTAILTACCGAAYSWSDGSSTDTIKVSLTTLVSLDTLYFVTVTSVDGCTATASILVTVNPKPSATISLNDSIICLGDSATLIASGGVDYLWDNGETNDTIIVSPAFTTGYTVTVTDNNSNTTTASQTITVNPLPTATINGTVSVCKNDAAPVITFTGNNGTQPYIFTYTIDSGIPISDTTSGYDTIQVTTPANVPDTFIYQLISVSDSNGCMQPVNAQSATIIVNPLPTATIIGEDSVCKNDPISPLIKFIGHNGIQNYTFTYSINGDTMPTVASSGSDTATVSQLTDSAGIFLYELISVSDGNGCTDSVVGQSATIIVRPLPTATISGTTAVCKNTTPFPLITFTGDSGTQNYTFTYSVNGVTQNPIIATNASVATVQQSTDSAKTFVYQLISVSDTNGCSQAITSQSATITVNPLPTANINGTTFVCKNDPISPPVTFTGSNGTPPYTFSYSINGAAMPTVVSSGSDTAIVTAPTTDTGTFVYTIISVSDSNGCSDTVSTQSATITVNPFPTATISGDTAVCKNDPVSPLITFIGDSGTQNYTFTYTINGVSNTVTSSGNDTAIVTASTTDTGTFVYVITSVSDGNGCLQTVSGQTATITVNALPTATITGPDSACQYDPDVEISFIGHDGKKPYTFIYTINGITATISGSDTVLVLQPTDSANTYVYQLISVSDSNGCSQGQSGSASIKINPVPDNPVINSLIKDSGSVCAGSTNINFYVANPDPHVNYLWQITAGDANLRNDSGANTVINFGNTPGDNVGIKVTATNGSKCSTDDSLLVIIKSSADTIDERKIILKQPGNLLVYPDNSMNQGNGYQWGYDSIESVINNDTILGPPHDIPGQVYQFFIPGSKFLRDSSGYQVLNDTLYCFWVLIKNGECQSKVYYNGPYKFNPRPLPIEVDSVVALTVFPNPTTGDMNILVGGKIYGSIDAKIYSALGQIVYKTRFEKKQNTTTQNINLSKIPEGVYLLELISSDHQKLTTRIIVYH